MRKMRFGKGRLISSTTTSSAALRFRTRSYEFSVGVLSKHHASFFNLNENELRTHHGPNERPYHRIGASCLRI